MFFRSLIPAILWAIFILIICAIPGEKFPPLDFLQWLKPDKIIHLFVFGLLSYLTANGFARQSSFDALRSGAVLWAFVSSAAYGAIIEFLQSTVFINRSGDVRDIIANALGGLIGIWWYKAALKKRLRKNSSD